MYCVWFLIVYTVRTIPKAVNPGREEANALACFCCDFCVIIYFLEVSVSFSVILDSCIMFFPFFVKNIIFYETTMSVYTDAF